MDGLLMIQILKFKLAIFAILKVTFVEQEESQIEPTFQFLLLTSYRNLNVNISHVAER